MATFPGAQTWVLSYYIFRSLSHGEKTLCDRDKLILLVTITNDLRNCTTFNNYLGLSAEWQTDCGIQLGLCRASWAQYAPLPDSPPPPGDERRRVGVAPVGGVSRVKGATPGEGRTYQVGAQPSPTCPADRSHAGNQPPRFSAIIFIFIVFLSKCSYTRGRPEIEMIVRGLTFCLYSAVTNVMTPLSLHSYTYASVI